MADENTGGLTEEDKDLPYILLGKKTPGEVPNQPGKLGPGEPAPGEEAKFDPNNTEPLVVNGKTYWPGGPMPEVKPAPYMEGQDPAQVLQDLSGKKPPIALPGVPGSPQTIDEAGQASGLASQGVGKQANFNKQPDDGFHLISSAHAEPTERVTSIAQAAQAFGPGDESGEAEASAQPQGSERVTTLAGALARLSGGDDPAQLNTRYGLPVNPSFSEGLGIFFRQLPQNFARGLADSAGMPVDGINAVRSFYAHNPAMAVGESALGKPMEFDGGPTAPSIQGIGQDQQINPMPGGSQTARNLMGSIGINTNLSSEEGNATPAAKWAENLGYVAGSMSPFGMANIVKAAMAKSVPLVLKVAGKDVGLSLSSGGAGRVMEDDITGGPGPEGVRKAAGQVAGPVVMMGAFKAGGAITAARYLMVNGLHAAEKSGNPLVSQIVSGNLNAGAAVRGTADDAATAAINARTAGTQEGFGKFLEGTYVPPALASMDDGLRTLQFVRAQQDRYLNNQLRAHAAGNEDLLRNAEAIAGGAGEGDVTATLASRNAARTADKQAMIDNAVRLAERDFNVATAGATLNPLDSKAITDAAALNLKGYLTNAMETSSLAARQDLEAAAAKGLNGATVGTNRLYDRLSDMMSEAIKTGNKSHFPDKVIKDLYTDERPMKMFDNGLGQPVGTPSENFALGTSAPWERMHGLYNNIENELVNIAKTGSDPIRAAYLTRIQDEVLTAMKDLRQNGRFTPNAVPEALQNFLNAQAENRRLFIDSPVGDLLGLSKTGMPTAGGQSVQAWLANSPETINKVQSLFDAVAQHPSSLAAGVNPVDAAGGQIKNWMRQKFADDFRSGGVAAGERFMANHSDTLNHPVFSDLRDDFRSALNSKQVAEDITGAPMSDVDAIRQQRVEAYLNNDVGTAIDKALFGPNRYKATQDIIADLKTDPTGRAMEGFGNQVFDRLRVASSQANPRDLVGGAFSGTAAEKFFTENAGVFRAIDEQLPGYKERVSQWVETAKLMDRWATNPQVPIDQKTLAFSLTGMGQIMAQVIGAKLGRDLHTGTIQVPGIFSRLAGGAFANLFQNMPAERAASLVSRAMVEPELFQKLMTPLTSAQTQQQVVHFLEPYLLSAPSVVYNTNQQYTNPQQPQGQQADFNNLTKKLTGKIGVPGGK